MSSRKCPKGHKAGRAPFRPTAGKKGSPRCPVCLALPIQDVFFEPDKRSQSKYLASILASVSRGHDPVDSEDVEEVSLALKKDRKWRSRQLEVMRGIQKTLMVAKFDQEITFLKKIDQMAGKTRIVATVDHSVQWRPIANLLIDAGILDVVILLLKVRLPNSVAEEVDSEGDPWNAVYYYSLDIISNIMLTGYWENPKAKIFINKLAQSAFVDAAMAFVDNSKYFLCMVMSVYDLCHIYEERPTAGFKLVNSNLLPKLGLYIHKDNSIRIMHRWSSVSRFYYEYEVLMENYAGLPPMRSESVFIVSGVQRYTDNDINDISTQFANTLQQSCLQCLSHLCKDKKVRSLVTKDQIIGKALGRWVRMPILCPDNRYQLQACLKAISDMVRNAEFATKILDEHGFLALLENGVYYPDHCVVWHYLDIAVRIGMHRGPLLKRIVENPVLVRSAAIHMYSLDDNCHIYSTALLALSLDSPGVENVIRFFGPKHFYYYPDYFFARAPKLGIRISELQVGCKRFGKKQYDKAQKEFSKIRHLILDNDKASKLKEEGNQCYKNGRCQDAISLYTQALSVCPPTKLDQPGKRRGPLDALPKWNSLPPTLFSNRAQCYLNLGEYEKAVEDCDEAIARCLGGVDEDEPDLSDTVRLKAMFRRSKALFELGQYFRAVQDVGECQVTQPSETFKAHLDKVMIRFRNIYGMDPVQRCDECRQTNGFKLKRCAHCMAVYCTKKCQENAWVKRHMTNCQEYQVEKEALKNEAMKSAAATNDSSCNSASALTNGNQDLD